MTSSLSQKNTLIARKFSCCILKKHPGFARVIPGKVF
jgi:hypothetical protein